jgi:dephospho-CoA kinase
MGLIIVTGPPCSGKTTWVRGQARAGDVVVDYDALAHALAAPGADSHDHPRHIKTIAYRARRAAIEEALKHIDRVDVYVIHSQPSADALTRYAEHGARVVTIDPGRDIVMRRITEQRPASMVAVAERWYASTAHAEQSPQRSSRSW